MPNHAPVTRCAICGEKIKARPKNQAFKLHTHVHPSGEYGCDGGLQAMCVSVDALKMTTTKTRTALAAT